MILIIAIGIPFLIGAIIYAEKTRDFDKKTEGIISNINQYIKEHK